VSGERIGWLGGSFDPVHEGHLHIARAALEELELDRVLLVPAHQPPHKRDRTLAPGADRLALLEIACASDPRLQPHDIELRRGGLSYSYDTAEQLLRDLPAGSELFLIVGADMLADLPHWHRGAELARLVNVCPVERPGHDGDPPGLAEALGADTLAAIRERTLRPTPHPASSTAIREALGRGESPDWLLAGVGREIRRRGLYGLGGASSSDISGADRSSP
jgi:nicotinate-nucleotide adenylyltransferase